jgi:intracellular multiplication protein IcmC
MGFFFIFYGILKLKEFGEARTQMSSERHLKGPLIYIIVGSLLLYFPTTIQIGLSTFWSQPSPYGYMQETDQWADFMKDVFLVVQLFGTIAFIRGLVILSHLSGHGQPGTFGKGVTHIIGGLFCINIYQFVQVILITLGIQT